MDQSNNSLLWIRRAILSAGIATLAYVIYLFVAAILARGSTGILVISSTDSKATLSVSQMDKAAKIIGVGKAKARLKPGLYEVAAASNGNQAFQAVSVTAKTSSSITLNPVKATLLPSISNISFSGMNALVNHGLTHDQIKDLEHAFFKFKPSASAVNIDSNSIFPGPIDPNTAGFNTRFSVDIDSINYSATIKYIGLSDLELMLFNAAGNQIFDSGVITSS